MPWMFQLGSSGQVAQLALGSMHSCAASSGKAWNNIVCWGSSALEQTAIPAVMGSGVRVLAAGGDTTCASALVLQC